MSVLMFPQEGPMTDARFEKKLLLQALSLLRGQETELRSQKLLALALNVIGGVMLLAAYLLTVRSVIDERIGILLAAIGGNFVAVAAYMGVCMRQWPVLKPHLRIETIEERLREMET
jgi:hypothetical protein